MRYLDAPNSSQATLHPKNQATPNPSYGVGNPYGVGNSTVQMPPAPVQILVPDRVSAPATLPNPQFSPPPSAFNPQSAIPFPSTTANNFNASYYPPASQQPIADPNINSLSLLSQSIRTMPKGDPNTLRERLSELLTKAIKDFDDKQSQAREELKAAKESMTI